MKKISTAAVQKIERVVGQRVPVGLDLEDRSRLCCVLDVARKLLLERKLATTPKAMKEVFGGMPRSRIALRTVGTWKTLQTPAPQITVGSEGAENVVRGGNNGKKRPVVAVARKLAILLHRSALTFGETMATNDSIQPEILPVPDRKPIGLTMGR